MCGIVGYIGKEQAGPLLLDGLKRLEYRGYDSAGLAIVSANKNLQVKKCKGHVAKLCALTDDGRGVSGTVGIGHTRWATHGEPNDSNAHPHVSQTGKVAVVHNGIIENYSEIKEFLLSEGVRFTSDTDTEVVAQLLEYYFSNYDDIFDSTYKVLDRIRGAYALAIVCADDPDRIIAARKDAPLILGYGKDASFIASDVTALIAHTRDVSYMEDGDVAVLRRDGIRLYDAFRRPAQRTHHQIDWDISAAEKGGYPHFMLKEILEQPEAVQKTVSPRLKHGKIVFDELSFGKDAANTFENIFIVACGSSYHVGMIGKYNLEKLLRIPVEPTLASEFRYSDPLVTDRSLVIVISQSGETLDTLEALKEARRLGGYILSIVNVVGSSIARASDDVLYTHAGPEIAVATTKAYSTQLMLLNMLGLYLSDLRGTVDDETYKTTVAAMEALPAQMQSVLTRKDDIQYLASQHFNHDRIFFIGRNLDYALGLEGSLKLKEISYIHSEAYASGELKHGTISLIEEGTLVVALSTYAPLFEKALSNIMEVRARGADVLALTTDSRAGVMTKTASHVLAVPETVPMLQPSLGILPLQLFAYYVALLRGCDIDKPRNLAKSVTVE